MDGGPSTTSWSDKIRDCEPIKNKSEFNNVPCWWPPAITNIIATYCLFRPCRQNKKALENITFAKDNNNVLIYYTGHMRLRHVTFYWLPQGLIKKSTQEIDNMEEWKNP